VRLPVAPPPRRSPGGDGGTAEGKEKVSPDHSLTDWRLCVANVVTDPVRTYVRTTHYHRNGKAPRVSSSKAQASGSKGKWAAGTGYGGGTGGGNYYAHNKLKTQQAGAVILTKQEEAARGRQVSVTEVSRGLALLIAVLTHRSISAHPQDKEDAAYLALLKRWQQALPQSPQTPILPETQHLLARAMRTDVPAVSSPLLRLLRLLLLNDSVMDMTARREVYQAALDVMRALTAHPLVAPVLERPVEAQEEDEEEEEEKKKAIKGKGKVGISSSSTTSSSPSLLALLERLHSQVRRSLV